jgi:nicotinamidase-related amidase
MQARTLVIDAQRCNCDPSFIFKKEWEQAHYRFLDDTARKIGAFVNQTRDHSPPIWAMQAEELTKTFRRALSPEEAALHRVVRYETEPVLVKTRWSAVAENEEFFDQERERGIDTYILAGFWADKCLPENAQNLLDRGNRVIIPVDLTCGMDTLFTPDAYIDLCYHASFVLTESTHVVNMLQQPSYDRVMPKAKYNATEIFTMSYGFGG